MKRIINGENNSEFNRIADNPVGISPDGINTSETFDPEIINDLVPDNLKRAEREYKTTEEKKAISANSAKKAGGAFLTSVAAIMVLSTTILGGNAALPSAEISDIRIGDDEVGYTVVVDADDLNLELTNYFTSRTYPLEVGTNVGIFEDLEPSMEYTLSVTKGKDIWDREVLAEEKIRTGAPGTSMPITELRGVETECRCGIDGNFYFKLDLTDENGFYSDFKATMTDYRGNVRSLEFSDPDVEQKIYVRAREGEPFYGGSEHPVALKITCTTAEHGSDEEIVIYYNEEISI